MVKTAPWITKNTPPPASRMTGNTTERVSTRAMTTPPACHPRKLSFSRGPICRHPSAEGNLAFVSSRNKFPSVGGGDTGPRATRRVGGKGRGGKRLGDCDPEFFILSLRHVLEIQSFCKFAHNLNRYATVYHL